jgi:hypothetical protein
MSKSLKILQLAEPIGTNIIELEKRDKHSMA